MHKKTFIFDFDGTLINSFSAIIEKFNLLSSEFHFRKVNIEEIKDIQNLTSKELIKFFGISFYKLPKVVQRARELLYAEMQTMTPFENIQETIKQLAELPANLGILTSNSEENVTKWLQQHKMYHYFHFIHAGSSFFGKKSLLKKMIRNQNLDRASTFYIGDETRDIDAAKQCGIYSVAVTWGVGSENILSQSHPDFIVKTPLEILKLIQ